MTTFGERIRELRMAQKITQQKLARAVKIDFTYVSKMENNRLGYLPSEQTIRNIADALNTDALALLNLAGKIPLGFKDLLKDNPEAAELLRLLGEHHFSPEAYRKMLDIARANKG